MLHDYDPVVQALLGTLFTWSLTAAGAALVFVLHSSQRWLLDGSLGFAAGVMIAASYWSLLDPAIEIAKNSGNYGINGEYAFLPAGVGFLFGAMFVFAADKFIDWLDVSPHSLVSELSGNGKVHREKIMEDFEMNYNETYIGFPYRGNELTPEFQQLTNRRKVKMKTDQDWSPESLLKDREHNISKQNAISWRRLIMLIIAITVHNIPEGLAVGVGFAAVNKSQHSSFEKARNLAIGIGLQNFPEGLAVSLPLRSAGVSTWKSFWYGQLSGMVEPVAGVLGALLLSLAEPFLPYALAFAAGAMIYVVVDDIIPEANSCGNGTLTSWGTIIGFWIMMSLDVGLG